MLLEPVPNILPQLLKTGSLGEGPHVHNPLQMVAAVPDEEEQTQQTLDIAQVT